MNKAVNSPVMRWITNHHRVNDKWICLYIPQFTLKIIEGAVKRTEPLYKKKKKKRSRTEPAGVPDSPRAYNARDKQNSHLAKDD